MRKVAPLLVAAILFGSASAASAASIILDRGDAGPAGLDWGMLGPSFTVVPNGTVVGIINPVTLTTSTGTAMERRDEGNGWNGGFAPGDHLLWTRNVDTANLILDFAFPMLAVGADISSDVFGNFTAEITAFRGAINLGTFSVNGNNASSIPFLGVADEGGITRIVFRVSDGGNNRFDFAINSLSGTVAAVPEPGTIALLGLGLAGVAVRLRRRRV
jgi:hypothetical protein